MAYINAKSGVLSQENQTSMNFKRMKSLSKMSVVVKLDVIKEKELENLEWHRNYEIYSKLIIGLRSNQTENFKMSSWRDNLKYGRIFQNNFQMSIYVGYN